MPLDESQHVPQFFVQDGSIPIVFHKQLILNWKPCSQDPGEEVKSGPGAWSGMM